MLVRTKPRTSVSKFVVWIGRRGWDIDWRASTEGEREKERDCIQFSVVIVWFFFFVERVFGWFGLRWWWWRHGKAGDVRLWGGCFFLLIQRLLRNSRVVMIITAEVVVRVGVVGGTGVVRFLRLLLLG